MKNMLLLVVVSGVLLGACVNNTNSTTAEEAKPAVEQKQGDTTKSGTLVEKGGKYFIQTATGALEEVESYVVELSEYVGSSVTVTGQYSGDTLLVGKIE